MGDLRDAIAQMDAALGRLRALTGGHSRRPPKPNEAPVGATPAIALDQELVEGRRRVGGGHLGDGCLTWHGRSLPPLVSDEERYSLMSAALKVCVGRCARVSLETHDGRRDFGADVGLHDQLVGDKHWSPFEHAALPFRQPWWKRWAGHSDRVGNFNGWLQYRKQFASEHPYTPGQVEP